MQNQTGLSNDQIRQVAPSVFATEPFVNMSERYAFIPTSDIMNRMRKEGFLPVAANQSLSRFKGKQPFTKHMLRFRHQDLLNRPKEVKGEIPEIVLVNSHDGSACYQIHVGMFRLVCSNGMIAKSADFGTIQIRHSGNIADDVIEGSYRVIDNVPLLMDRIEEMKGITLDRIEQEAFSELALEIRHPLDDNGNSTASFPASNLLEPKRFYYGVDAEPSLWNTFNNIQENLIRGGIEGVNSNGRRTRTRPIQSVNSDLATNRELWKLTDSLREELVAA